MDTDYRSIILLLVCSLPSASFATAWESSDNIQAAAESFVKQKTAAIDGQVSVSSIAPDDRIKVTKCDALETTLPASNRLWGRSTVKVSCNRPAKWSLYIPVMVRVTGKGLVSNRAIATGQTISEQDVQLQEIELTAYPTGILTNPEQAIGKVAANAIGAGSPIRTESLRAPLAIRQGQQVVVVAYGTNFKVSSEGTALGNAQPGQVVAVKTKSGITVKGIARGDSIVEVMF